MKTLLVKALALATVLSAGAEARAEYSRHEKIAMRVSGASLVAIGPLLILGAIAPVLGIALEGLDERHQAHTDENFQLGLTAQLMAANGTVALSTGIALLVVAVSEPLSPRTGRRVKIAGMSLTAIGAALMVATIALSVAAWQQYRADAAPGGAEFSSPRGSQLVDAQLAVGGVSTAVLTAGVPLWIVGGASERRTPVTLRAGVGSLALTF
ncbi:MAG TPA: hypothetical protein VFF06_20155 [Polyangia bacterium]|nr:hypothetical protein [Polyangia bacterium]